MATNQSQYEEMCEVYERYNKGDLVPVVRCKKCRRSSVEYWTRDGLQKTDDRHLFCKMANHLMRVDDFCSWGEEKMNDRLISMEALMKRINCYPGIRDAVAKELQYVPTVDAEPVKHGCWCFVEFPDGYYHWECSECTQWFKEDSMSLTEEWEYCPFCGAKMDGGEDDPDM